MRFSRKKIPVSGTYVDKKSDKQYRNIIRIKFISRQPKLQHIVFGAAIKRYSAFELFWIIFGEIKLPPLLCPLKG